LSHSENILLISKEGRWVLILLKTCLQRKTTEGGEISHAHGLLEST
jgi:hypothetical protein